MIASGTLSRHWQTIDDTHFVSHLVPHETEARMSHSVT